MLFRVVSHPIAAATVGRTSPGKAVLVRAFIAALGLAFNAGHPTPADAQRLRVAVIGDSLANDLGSGLQRLYRGKRNISIVKETRSATGLVRKDYFNWEPSLRTFVRKTRANVFLVLIGGNDSQAIRVKGRNLPRFSRTWTAEYQRRVGRFMQILRRSRGKIYWVGLPPVRSAAMSRRYRAMNRIFRRQARQHGIRYVSLWRAFSDRKGGYKSFERDSRGVRRQLRKSDGMHFTMSGAMRLAAHVSRAIELF